jgi:hypothetical protein
LAAKASIPNTPFRQNPMMFGLPSSVRNYGIGADTIYPINHSTYQPINFKFIIIRAFTSSQLDPDD